MATIAARLPETQERSWSLWTTTAQVIVHDPGPGALDAADAAARRVTAEVERACSRFRPDAELMARAVDLHRGCIVSPLLADLIRTALDAAEATEGDVDPTLGAEMISLGYDLHGPGARPVSDAPAHRAPGDGRITSTGRSPRWRDIELDGTWLRVPEGMVLDLGATAKAWAADRAAALAAEASGAGVLVSLGGDIATAGSGPRDGWQILAQDTDEDPAQIISLRSGWAIATSSTSHRRWEQDGTLMHHILDPRWGVPAPVHWRSVTVAAPTCVTANTWSTASIVRGHRAEGDLRARGLAARLVDLGQATTTTAAWPDAG